MSMVTTKVTFTLDVESITRLNDASSRLSLPKSEIVREAIHEFHERIGRLGERERVAMLRTFDDLVPKIPIRPEIDVDRELEDLRKARRVGGRAAAAAKA